MHEWYDICGSKRRGDSFPSLCGKGGVSSPLREGKQTLQNSSFLFLWKKMSFLYYTVLYPKAIARQQPATAKKRKVAPLSYSRQQILSPKRVGFVALFATRHDPIGPQTDHLPSITWQRVKWRTTHMSYRPDPAVWPPPSFPLPSSKNPYEVCTQDSTWVERLRKASVSLSQKFRG